MERRGRRGRRGKGGGRRREEGGKGKDHSSREGACWGRSPGQLLSALRPDHQGTPAGEMVPALGTALCGSLMPLTLHLPVPPKLPWRRFNAGTPFLKAPRHEESTRLGVRRSPFELSLRYLKLQNLRPAACSFWASGLLICKMVQKYLLCLLPRIFMRISIRASPKGTLLSST